MRNNLDSVIEQLAEQSKRTWVFRGKKETHDSVIHIWNRFKGKHGGFFYSINRDHPFSEIFEEAPPDIKRNLETLLKAIETSIPLNQLYVDLTSEKQLENETETTAQEVESMLQGLINQMPNLAAKVELLDRLAISEPFINYPALIDKYKTRGKLNGGN